MIITSFSMIPFGVLINQCQARITIFGMMIFPNYTVFLHYVLLYLDIAQHLCSPMQNILYGPQNNTTWTKSCQGTTTTLIRNCR